MSNVIEGYSELWLGDDGIVYTFLFPNVHLTLELAIKHVQAVTDIGNGKRPPLLVDCRNIHSITKEARDYLSKSKQSINSARAVALWVESPVSRIVGNFFENLNKSNPMPFKIFTLKDKAIVWLEGFLNE